MSSPHPISAQILACHSLLFDLNGSANEWTTGLRVQRVLRYHLYTLMSTSALATSKFTEAKRSCRISRRNTGEELVNFCGVSISLVENCGNLKELMSIQHEAGQHRALAD